MLSNFYPSFLILGSLCFIVQLTFQKVINLEGIQNVRSFNTCTIKNVTCLVLMTHFTQMQLGMERLCSILLGHGMRPWTSSPTTYPFQLIASGSLSCTLPSLVLFVPCLTSFSAFTKVKIVSCNITREI